MSAGGMRAVDTNLLLRLLVRDDDRQTEAAEKFISKGAWVSMVALVETVWVLDAVYERTPEQLAAGVEMLLTHTEFSLQDADAVASALNIFRSHPSLGFSDCLILESARKAGHLPLGSFDRGLGKLEGAQRI